MHEIQTQILKQLTLSEKARYSNIKPPKVGGNQFAYHLKQTIDDGYVKKEGSFYSLTEKGEHFADTISLKTFTKRSQPKIVTMIFAENGKKEILFYERDKQPFIGKYSLPYGKIHLGERIEESAKRETEEKTGIGAKKLKHRGDAYVAIYKKEEIISHMLCHIFEVKLPEGKTKDSCFWKDAKDIKNDEFVPGIKDILNLLAKNKEKFFKEIFVEA